MRPRRFYTKDALSVQTNLGRHLQFVWLCVFSIKMGTRRIVHLDELSFEIRLERRTTRENSSRRIIRLVPVFILKTHNQTDYKCLPKFVRTDDACLV